MQSRRPSPEVIRVDFRNIKYEWREGRSWNGTALSSAAGQLKLRAEWPSDFLSACGACLYDFSFEVQIDADAETIDAEFEVMPCRSCDTQVQRISVKPAA